MNDVQAKLCGVVRDNPGATLTDLNRLLGRGRKSRGGTHRDVQVLVDEGEVRRERDGACVRHYPVDGA